MFHSENNGGTDLKKAGKAPHANLFTGTRQPVVALTLNAKRHARKWQLALSRCQVWPNPVLILSLPLPKLTLYQRKAPVEKH